MTVAAFMELALYDPAHGYYATSPQRSGAAGDFFTSVDVGPLFGEMLAVQIAEVWEQLRTRGQRTFDLVEVGAGNGRLTRDILETAAREFPGCYGDLRVTLVDRSAAARRAAADTLAAHADKVVDIRADLPDAIRGVIFGNELLDAFPVHVLTMTADGLREVYVTGRGGSALAEQIGPVSDGRLSDRLADGHMPVGWRGEMSLDGPAWIGRAAAVLEQGFLVLFDYARAGSVRSDRAVAPDGLRPAGSPIPDPGRSSDTTLLSYSRHTAGVTSWMDAPGQQDITAHVDLMAVCHAATKAGLEVVGCVDQTYFLTALGIIDRLRAGDGGHGGNDIEAVRRRLAARTLIMPGGLGSTLKAIAFGKGVEGVELRGFAGGRLT
jgi:SAM-dependent MidA family methyltransferase